MYQILLLTCTLFYCPLLLGQVIPQQSTPQISDSLPPTPKPPFALITGDYLWQQSGVNLSQQLGVTISPVMFPISNHLPVYAGFTIGFGSVSVYRNTTLGATVGVFPLGDPTLGLMIFGYTGPAMLSQSGNLFGADSRYALAINGGALFMYKVQSLGLQIDLGYVEHMYTIDSGILQRGLRLGLALPFFRFF